MGLLREAQGHGLMKTERGKGDLTACKKEKGGRRKRGIKEEEYGG